MGRSLDGGDGWWWWKRIGRLGRHRKGTLHSVVVIVILPAVIRIRMTTMMMMRMISTMTVVGGRFPDRGWSCCVTT